MPPAKASLSNPLAARRLQISAEVPAHTCLDLPVQGHCLDKMLHVISVALNIAVDFGEGQVVRVQRIKVDVSKCTREHLDQTLFITFGQIRERLHIANTLHVCAAKMNLLPPTSVSPPVDRLDVGI
jgi:hypothetical protein